MNETINDYEVGAILGKGGFAVVHRARSKKCGRDVAIKFIDKDKLLNGKLKERVKQEVKIQTQIKHPYILELENVFEDSKYIHLVLELCDDGTLQQHVEREGSIQRFEARHCMVQIVDAMLYLHSNQIIHRDLTLANILIKNKTEMELRVADFGLATKVEDAPHKTFCGTPNYISPEMVEQKPHGQKADVWSLGVMFYTLQAGKPPFNTNSTQDTLSRVTKEQYKPVKGITNEAADLLDKLLQKNPENRIALQDVTKHLFMTKNANDSGRDRTNQDVSIDSGRGTGMMSTLHSVSHLSQERVALDKIDTTRLAPMRHRLKMAIATILENGDVCLEFLKKRSWDRVMEVLLVSGDGEQIKICQPNGRKGVPVDDLQPVALPNVSLKSFMFHELPQRYHKKYRCADWFIKLVRTKTPKVTLHTEKCKCLLMESGPEAFEAKFHDGTRVKTTSTSLIFESEDMEKSNTQNCQEMKEYVQKCKRLCQEVEAIFSKLEAEFSMSVFPAIIGRRRSPGLNDSGKFSTTSFGTASDDHNISSTDSNQMSFNSTMVSNVTTDSVTTDSMRPKCKSLDSSGLRSQSHTPNRVGKQHRRNSKMCEEMDNIPIEGGVLTMYESGACQANFFANNTKLEISVSGVVYFTDERGQQARYSSKSMPAQVQRCLEVVQKASESRAQAVP